MVRVQKNIIVGKPAQAIWAILDDPVQSSRLNPHFKLMYCYESKLGGHDRVFRYCMGGKTFEAGSQMVVYDRQRHMAYKTCGGFQSCWHWWLESDGRQTHVSLTIEYSLPKALCGAETETLEAENARVFEEQLTTLKRLAEAA